MQSHDLSKIQQDRPEIALFPIPDLVAFPGTMVPLHIFEPRYRTMINDCISSHRMVGLCHTRKKISGGKLHKSPEESLRSNQATYQPFDVFSAGFCDIVKVLDGGRIHVIVKVTDRYTIVDEIQTLPYRIVRSQVLEDFPDEAGPNDDALSFKVQQGINNLLLKLIDNKNPSLVRRINWEKWQSLPPAEYSFRLFDILRFDADVMQTVLENRSVLGRLTMIWRILDHATNSDG